MQHFGLDNNTIVRSNMDKSKNVLNSISIAFKSADKGYIEIRCNKTVIAFFEPVFSGFFLVRGGNS